MWKMFRASVKLNLEWVKASSSHFLFLFFLSLSFPLLHLFLFLFSFLRDVVVAYVPIPTQLGLSQGSVILLPASLVHSSLGIRLTVEEKMSTVIYFNLFSNPCNCRKVIGKKKKRKREKFYQSSKVPLMHHFYMRWWEIPSVNCSCTFHLDR